MVVSRILNSLNRYQNHRSIDMTWTKTLNSASTIELYIVGYCFTNQESIFSMNNNRPYDRFLIWTICYQGLHTVCTLFLFQVVNVKFLVDNEIFFSQLIGNYNWCLLDFLVVDDESVLEMKKIEHRQKKFVLFITCIHTHTLV